MAVATCDQSAIDAVRQQLDHERHNQIFDQVKLYVKPEIVADINYGAFKAAVMHGYPCQVQQGQAGWEVLCFTI